MTNQQIQYMNYLESSKHNRATEDQAVKELGETVRSNKVREKETYRSNLAKEKETKRSNRAKEKENTRSNLAKEKENIRSNLARENENIRSNLAHEGETYRHNLATEKLDSRQISELIRSNLERERETARHNVATETLTSKLNASQIALNEIKTLVEPYAHGYLGLASKVEQGLSTFVPKESDLGIYSKTHRGMQGRNY